MPGFTLVELLVALGLVALMMLLFAEVFQIATGTMSTQRGVMENDQRARSLTTIFRNDLKYRSMRSVMPFVPNETDYPVTDYFSFANRQGFLSISENKINVDDDVLHFTTFISDASVEPYHGRALGLPIGAANLVTYPNQPDADDGVIFSNATAASRMAEVVYFVRGGNLYRRVLLLRQPLDSGDDRQPFDSVAANNYFDYTQMTGPRYAAGSDFYRDFDFSARYSTTGAVFLGSGGASGSLNPLDNGAGVGAFPIAIPLNRFGHDPDTANANTSAMPSSVGNPREYVFDNGGNSNVMFIGRFTHQETSHPDFNFPHTLSTVGNPMNQSVGLTLNSANVVTQFSGVSANSRRGEDILLTNVHGFDVKVWDEVIGDYVDIGHALSNGGVAGDLNQGRNLRPTYGPQITLATNRMFDTWHPAFDANNDSMVDTTDDNPPFAPRYEYRANGVTTAVSNQWTSGATYKIGSVIVPTTANGFAYRAISITSGGAASNTGVSGGTQPTWDTTVGGTTLDDAGGGNTITWQTIPNVKRVKSLKITIRYLDVTSDQMRQVTLIQSLLD